MKNISLDIFRKIFIALIIIQLQPSITLLLSISQRADDNKYAAEREIIDKAYLIDSQIDRWIYNEVKVSRLTVELEQFRSFDVEQMKLILREIVRVSDIVFLARIDDYQGNALARSDDKPLENYKDRKSFQDALNGNIGQEVNIEKLYNRPVLCFSVPVFSRASSIHGVMSQCAFLDIISQKVANLKIGKTGFGFLIDDQNKLIARGQNDTYPSLDAQDLSEHPAVLNPSKGEVFQFEKEGKNYIGVKVETGLEWQLIVQQEYEEVFETVIKSRQYSLALIFISLLLSCLIAYFISKRMAQKLTEISLYDPLTDLPNRRLFDESISQMIARCKRSLLQLVVVHVDIRDFKTINTNYGHHGGDIVLKELGNRMRGSIREVDMVARLGGDEFAVVFTDTDKTHIKRLANLLLKICDDPFDIEGELVDVNINLGFASYPNDGLNGESLIKAADLAFYESKKRGTDFEVFS